MFGVDSGQLYCATKEGSGLWLAISLCLLVLFFEKQENVKRIEM